MRGIMHRNRERRAADNPVLDGWGARFEAIEIERRLNELQQIERAIAHPIQHVGLIV